MALFVLAKATIVPFFMVLKLLGFVWCRFVGKLTKQMSRYNRLDNIGTILTTHRGRGMNCPVNNWSESCADARLVFRGCGIFKYCFPVRGRFIIFPSTPE
jgi:hypothetical protein